MSPRQSACFISSNKHPFCREFECELELVSSGIRRLKHLSQALDDGIEQEER